MPMLNTRVAKMQSKATSEVCTATAAPLAGLGDDGSLPPETASVLIFVKGQKGASPADQLKGLLNDSSLLG